jgi:hypothetical protein
VTTSGSSTFVSRPPWQRPHIIWAGPFAPLLLSLGLMDAATEGEPFSGCVENCGRNLQRLARPLCLCAGM